MRRFHGAGYIRAVNLRRVDERRVGIHLLANAIDHLIERTVELDDLRTGAERVELRIANWHWNIEKLEGARGRCQVHVVINELSPLPEIIGRMRGTRDIMFLRDDQVADLSRAFLTNARRRTHAVGVIREPSDEGAAFLRRREVDQWDYCRSHRSFETRKDKPPAHRMARQWSSVAANRKV